LPELSAACCAPLAAPALSADAAAATAALFRALADPHRVRIVNLLATSAEPVCVCDLQALLGLAQPTVSHHLKSWWAPDCSPGPSEAPGPTTRWNRPR
jgi:ArsR family transcriptional regulator